MKKLFAILMVALALGACCKAKTKCENGTLYVYKPEIKAWLSAGANCLPDDTSAEGVQHQ